MKIIITGGSGFIGTNLTRFLKKDHEITVLDSRKSELDGVKFIKGNITDSRFVIDSLKNCEIVVHLAAAVGVENTESDLINTLDVNIGGSRNVVEACRVNHVKKIIFSSSSEVYGEPVKLPIEETDTPMPVTTYGVSKFAAEEYVKSYAKTYGFKYTILRFFNAYGVGQSTNFVISEFVNSALNNRTIIVHSDGTQIRAFCNINDIVNGIKLALTKGDDDIFNIGNDAGPISIKDLAKKIISLANSSSNMTFLPFEKSRRNRVEILNRIPSIEKAKRILGYQPQVTLDEGIKSIIEFMRKQH